jgi:hypothetical protein
MGPVRGSLKKLDVPQWLKHREDLHETRHLMLTTATMFSFYSHRTSNIFTVHPRQFRHDIALMRHLKPSRIHRSAGLDSGDLHLEL